ncbi:MAG TPA: hypothetical protein VII56_13860 [Rhizomicrobium sp.]
MMKFIFGVAAGLLLFSGAAQARDEFDAMHCGGDIPKALIGHVMMDERVVVTEAKHKDIALVDEGAEIINDRLQMVSWRICGGDYNMLVDGKNVIRDVLAFPAHSRATPEFSGLCRVGGKEMTDSVYALLDNRSGFDPNTAHHYAPDDGTLLPALAAWRVDEKRAKFVSVPVKGMSCPRSGLFTLDGGA